MAVRQYFRANQAITASKIRLIDESGKQVGVVDKFKALEIAKSKGLDLVEIAAAAFPPVCKLVDLRRFIYEQEKKARAVKSKTKKVEIKEIRLTPFIGKQDLLVKMNHTKQFLQKGDGVKITVTFKPRQLAHSEFGFELIKKIEENLSEVARVEKEARLEGRQLSTIFVPKKHEG